MGLTPVALANQSHSLASRPASAERLLNLYAEALPEGSRSPFILKPAPGTKLAFALGSGPIRAVARIPGVMYVVSGTGFWRILDIDQEAPQFLGDIGQGVFPPSIAVGPDQVVVCVPPYAFIADHVGDASAISQITTGTGNFPEEGASSVAWLDGYFIFTSYDGQYFFVSNLLDGTTYDSLDFASSERRPDYVQRAITHNGELWLFGETGSAVWYNAGAADFPFRERAGSNLEHGLASPLGVARLDASLFWLGNDRVVYRSEGYQARRVSSHAVEEVLTDYGDLRDAVVCAFLFEGHSFFVMSLPSTADGGRTFVYDAATQLWHERGGPIDGKGRWQINCAILFGSRLLLGSAENGGLYDADAQLAYDFNRVIQRVAVLPAIVTHGPRAFMSRLEIEMEVGTDGAPSGVTVDWSDDGGITWSAPRVLPTGAGGATRTRVATTRCGSFRQRTIRLQAQGRMTIYGVDADIGPGNA